MERAIPTTILSLPPELIHEILRYLDADNLREIDPALLNFISFPNFKYIGFDYLFYVDLSFGVSVGFEVYLESRVSILQYHHTMLLEAIANRLKARTEPFGNTTADVSDGYMSVNRERQLRKAWKAETHAVFADFHNSWGERKKSAAARKTVADRDAVWVELALDRLGEDYHGLKLGRDMAESLRREIGLFEASNVVPAGEHDQNIEQIGWTRPGRQS